VVIGEPLSVLSPRSNVMKKHDIFQVSLVLCCLLFRIILHCYASIDLFLLGPNICS
jgi:hypothetical protein